MIEEKSIVIFGLDESVVRIGTKGTLEETAKAVSSVLNWDKVDAVDVYDEVNHKIVGTIESDGAIIMN